MSQRLSRVFFTTPVQDPSAEGLFERKDFNKSSAKGVLMERADDGVITLTAKETGVQVIASGVPYWCNPCEVKPPKPPKEVTKPPGKGLPPVTQSQMHPLDRIFPK